MKTIFPPDSPTFGDRVRIRRSAETEARGLADLLGHVYGQTTPSQTGVEVIGELTTDYAINVYFDELQESFWFAQPLVEFVDHAPGTEVAFKDASTKWLRMESGEWVEEPVSKRRWRFWK